MKTDLTAQAETAYHGFKAIDSGEYREKISFVDRNKGAIRELPVVEYAEVMDSYADALFEMGKYADHIPLADHLAELAIEYNLGIINGRDLYYETLFQKAASLYNLDRLHEAMHILQELVKIDPKHESTRLFLINCHVEKHKRKLHLIRTVSLALIACSALVIGFELLLIRSFLPEYLHTVELIRNTLFLSGAAILLAGELYIRYRAVSRVYDFSRNHERTAKKS
jgi:tetratricopeptide (TPR) repeat protein